MVHHLSRQLRKGLDTIEELLHILIAAYFLRKLTIAKLLYYPRPESYLAGLCIGICFFLPGRNSAYKINIG
jgi:hypothetical protein